MIYALDTDTIWDILRGTSAARQRWRLEESTGNRSIIPLMAYYEVRRGLRAYDATGIMKSFDELCAVLGISDLTVYDMNTAAVIYAALKRQGESMDDSDILIAAQCIENGYMLVTDNTQAFERVNGLQLVNWLE